MMKLAEVSLDDEVAEKFIYDIDNKVIEVWFGRYYDLKMDDWVDKRCALRIEKWEKAQSRAGGSVQWKMLDDNIGVFSLILLMEVEDEKLSLTVLTIDSRIVDLVFIHSQCYLHLSGVPDDIVPD